MLGQIPFPVFWYFILVVGCCCVLPLAVSFFLLFCRRRSLTRKGDDFVVGGSTGHGQPGDTPHSIVVRCDWGGSSAENLLERNWSTLRKYPEVQVQSSVKRNAHPTLGLLWRGNPKIIDLKNKSIVAVEAEVEGYFLSGRKMTQFSEPVRSQTPSLRGVWEPTIPFQSLQFEHIEQAQTNGSATSSSTPDQCNANS